MDNLKAKAAQSALAYLDDERVIGVGTGSTVNYFIDALASIRHRIEACVASSDATAERLRRVGIPVIDLNVADEISVYIDGADEVNFHRQMIKGGGGALTREKILASAASKFICIVDERKVVHRLGEFPIAVEVIPMARSFVARALVKLGGDPAYRHGFQTDNGNILLDVFGFDLTDPVCLENAVNVIPGVVENGLFANRLADIVLIAGKDGVTVL